MTGQPTLVGRLPIGVVRVAGEDRLDLLGRLSTNELGVLAEPDRVASTILTTNKGRIVDWLSVVSRDDDLLVRTSPGRGERVREWLETYTVVEDVSASDESADWGLVVVHGPGAGELVGLEPPVPGRVSRHAGAVWMRGLEAFGPRLEAMVPVADADRLRDGLLARGSELAGASLLELLRVEAGVPGPDREFDREVNPLELRLAPAAVSFDKGCYVGQEVLARMDTYDKLARLLIGFESDDALPEKDRDLEVTRAGRRLGRITSVHNLAGGGAVGLGVVKREAAGEGEAEVVVGDRRVAVRLRDRPFWASRA